MIENTTTLRETTTTVERNEKPLFVRLFVIFNISIAVRHLLRQFLSHYKIDGPIVKHGESLWSTIEYILLLTAIVLVLKNYKLILQRCAAENCKICERLKKDPYSSVKRFILFLTAFTVLTPIIYFTVTGYIRRHPDDYRKFIDKSNWSYWIGIIVINIDGISFCGIWISLIDMYFKHPFREFVQLKQDSNSKEDLEKGLLSGKKD